MPTCSLNDRCDRPAAYHVTAVRYSTMLGQRVGASGVLYDADYCTAHYRMLTDDTAVDIRSTVPA